MFVPKAARHEPNNRLFLRQRSYFPLSVFSGLETEWQEAVIEIITAPPVNQILKVSTYTPSLAETVPITSVEKPPVSIAV
jgi:hypothetical protein